MKADYKANHRFKIKKRVTYYKLLFSFCGAYRTIVLIIITSV